MELGPSDENKVLGEREHSEESETNLAVALRNGLPLLVIVTKIEKEKKKGGGGKWRKRSTPKTRQE